MADIIEIKCGELLNLRKDLLRNEFTAKTNVGSITEQIILFATQTFTKL